MRKRDRQPFKIYLGAVIVHRSIHVISENPHGFGAIHKVRVRCFADMVDLCTHSTPGEKNLLSRSI